MTKCSHDLCLNEAESGSTYCKSCIQLPTKECNFCNLAEMTENRRLADSVQNEIYNRTKTFISLSAVILTIVILVGLAIVLWAIGHFGLAWW